jgi:Domain of unknown function DUF29
MPEASPSSISTSIRTTLYESDFYRWTQEQALLLKQGKWQEMDVENIIEEIVSLGKQQQQELAWHFIGTLTEMAVSTQPSE